MSEVPIPTRRGVLGFSLLSHAATVFRQKYNALSLQNSGDRAKESLHMGF